MYKKIYVPVDNSAHSNRAIESALHVGKAFGSELVGCHVYAAKMHDYRFKQTPTPSVTTTPFHSVRRRR